MPQPINASPVTISAVVRTPVRASEPGVLGVGEDVVGGPPSGFWPVVVGVVPVIDVAVTPVVAVV